MESKLSKVRALLTAGDETAVLRIVAGFRARVPRRRSSRGWAAHQNPASYESLGFDPAEFVRGAVTAIRAKDGI